ncbi:MAG: hypothetical protein K8W52_04000 [Deltaproteobacteria bacterium]|nr:hypothetical protein [Deltaproteobacteria bacterium]
MPRSLVFAAVLAIGASEARADVASPERSACKNKEPGDICWGPAWGSCVSASDRPPEHPRVYCRAGLPDGPFTWRIAVGLTTGLAVAAGGAWLALRKRDA